MKKRYYNFLVKNHNKFGDLQRRYFDVEEDRDILKRIVKTKDELYPDLEALKVKKDLEEKKVKIQFFKIQVFHKNEHFLI